VGWSNDSREKATTTSSPSVVTAANPTQPSPSTSSLEAPAGERDWSIIELELRKAVAAVWKASLISPLGMTEESLRLFALFFAKQCEFEPDTIEEMQMEYEGTDIEYALAVAEGSV
jgi:hypothetical protein